MGKATKKTTSGAVGLDATDIFNNLHKQVGKTAVAKVLSTLAEKGEITEKAYGKQYVYVVRQDTLPTPSPEELGRLDRQLESLKDTLTGQREKARSLQNQLGELQSSLASDELERRIKQLDKDVKSADVRLIPLRSGARRVDPDEKAKVDRELEVYTKEWRNRKRACMEIVNSITENLPQSPPVFMEELGMENDPSTMTKK